MFESILNADQAPRAVKYLFDFFDSQSEMILQTLGHASMSEKETGDVYSLSLTMSKIGTVTNSEN